MAISLLLPHQQEAISFLHKKNGQALLWLPCGSGKTLIAAQFCVEKRCATTLVICPSSVKLQWQEEIKRWFPRMTSIVIGGIPSYRKKQWALGADFVIVNYELLLRDFPLILDKKWDATILDECFTYSTKILTEIGWKKIGDIVENKLNVRVLTCDLTSGVLEYKQITHWFKNLRTDNLIKIILDNGNEIVCTPNHKIFVQEENSFRLAAYLQSGETVRIVSQDFYGYKRREKNSSFLFLSLFGKIQKYISFRHCGSSKIKKTISGKKLRMVPQKFFGSSQMDTKQSVSFLFAQLCRKMENEFTFISSKSLFKRKKLEVKQIIKIGLPEKPKLCKTNFRKNEKKQSNVESFDSRKNETKENWKNFFKSWRKWRDNKTSIIVGTEIKSKKMDGISDFDSICRSLISFFAKLLQSGYCFAGIQTGNRSGRWNAQIKKMEISGQKKNRSFEFARVASVEILERGNFNRTSKGFEKNRFVYNIEIEKNHNYFANGILVSNCHRISNARAKTTKIIKKISTTYKICLSGTVIKNHLWEIFSVMDFLSPGLLGKNWWSFRNNWLITNPYIPQMIIGVRDPHKLRETVAPFILHKTREEIALNLPALTEQTISFDLSTKELSVYKKLRDDFLLQLSDEKEETVGNVLVKLMRLRQSCCSLELITDFKESSKLKILFDLLQDLKEEKILIFTEFASFARLIYLKLVENKFFAGCITGESSMEERNNQIDGFMNGERMILVGTSAMSTGLNLQKATVVIHADQGWNEAMMDQRVSRAQRIGQKNNVVVYSLIARNTVDEWMAQLVKKKEQEIKFLTKKDIEDFFGKSSMEKVL